MKPHRFFLVAAILSLVACTNPADQPASGTTGSGASPAANTSSSQSVAKTSRYSTYFIALNDNGKKGKKIGCGDSVVPVTQTVSWTQTPLEAALKSLLATKAGTTGCLSGSDCYNGTGFYDSLHQSTLQLDSVTVQNGIATIKLNGKMALGGVCDDPRVTAQLEETAKQFPSVNDVKVFVNGKDLQGLLSQKGK